MLFKCIQNLSAGRGREFREFSSHFLHVRTLAMGVENGVLKVTEWTSRDSHRAQVPRSLVPCCFLNPATAENTNENTHNCLHPGQSELFFSRKSTYFLGTYMLLNRQFSKENILHIVEIITPSDGFFSMNIRAFLLKLLKTNSCFFW